jgi:hypothetical protein
MLEEDEEEGKALQLSCFFPEAGASARRDKQKPGAARRKTILVFFCFFWCCGVTMMDDGAAVPSSRIVRVKRTGQKRKTETGKNEK